MGGRIMKPPCDSEAGSRGALGVTGSVAVVSAEFRRRIEPDHREVRSGRRTFMNNGLSLAKPRRQGEYESVPRMRKE